MKQLKILLKNNKLVLISEEIEFKNEQEFNIALKKVMKQYFSNIEYDYFWIRQELDAGIGQIQFLKTETKTNNFLFWSWTTTKEYPQIIFQRIDYFKGPPTLIRIEVQGSRGESKGNNWALYKGLMNELEKK